MCGGTVRFGEPLWEQSYADASACGSSRAVFRFLIIAYPYYYTIFWIRCQAIFIKRPAEIQRIGKNCEKSRISYRIGKLFFVSSQIEHKFMIYFQYICFCGQKPGNKEKERMQFSQ